MQSKADRSNEYVAVENQYVAVEKKIQKHPHQGSLGGNKPTGCPGMLLGLLQTTRSQSWCPQFQQHPLLGLTRTTDYRRRSLLQTSALRRELTALCEMSRFLSLSFARSALPMPQRLSSSWHLWVETRSSFSYCVVEVEATSELV